MRALHAFLLAMTLPALLLPERVTLCLKQLFGEAVRTTCGESCCAHEAPAPRTQETQSVAGDERATCCVTTPATERTLDPTTRKIDAHVVAAMNVVACTPSFAFASESPFAPGVVARRFDVRHAPPVVPIAPSLRL